MSKELLFTITLKDFELQTFRAGGKGGQHQNKTDSGVRLIHKDSGTVGEARDSKSQHQNKKTAFKRCVESDVFKKWHKTECARRMGAYKDIDSDVEKAMRSKNIKVEYYDNNLEKFITVERSITQPEEIFCNSCKYSYSDCIFNTTYVKGCDWDVCDICEDCIDGDQYDHEDK